MASTKKAMIYYVPYKNLFPIKRTSFNFYSQVSKKVSMMDREHSRLLDGVPAGFPRNL